MQRSIEIPKALIYEEFDGHPVYRKGYRDYLVGTKTVEEIMGTSTLLWFIVTSLLRKILELFQPGEYLVGTNEPGVHLKRGTNLANDIAIYRKGQLKIGLNSVNYAEIPPVVAIEVDVRADCSDIFANEFEYMEAKSKRLLDFGAQKIIWIGSVSKKISIISSDRRWETIDWDLPFEVLDGKYINVWELMLKNGFEA